MPWKPPPPSKRRRAPAEPDTADGTRDTRVKGMNSSHPSVTKERENYLPKDSLEWNHSHNSGFYGHYRGQFKSESAREYRLAAKPQPPAVFLQRCQEPAQQHFFSKHDNRTSFDKGIGRRKDLERLRQQHTFLHWAPCDLEFSEQRPLESSYQANFRSSPGLSDLPQRLVHFVQIQSPHASTTYQQNFCQPSPADHFGTNYVGLQTPVTNTLPKLPGIPRPKLPQHYLHTGVSECLNWAGALNENG